MCSSLTPIDGSKKSKNRKKHHSTNNSSIDTYNCSKDGCCSLFRLPKSKSKSQIKRLK